MNLISTKYAALVTALGHWVVVVVCRTFGHADAWAFCSACAEVKSSNSSWFLVQFWAPEKSILFAIRNEM